MTLEEKLRTAASTLEKNGLTKTAALLSEAADANRELVEGLRTLCNRYGYEDDGVTPKDWSEWVEARALIAKMENRQ